MEHDEFNLPDSILSRSDWVEREVKCRDALVYCAKFHLSLQAIGLRDITASPYFGGRDRLLEIARILGDLGCIDVGELTSRLGQPSLLLGRGAGVDAWAAFPMPHRASAASSRGTVLRIP